MPTATEGAVDVDSRGLDVQSLNRLPQQDGLMLQSGASSQRQVFKAGGQELIAKSEDRLLLLLPAGIRPDLEMTALADQPDLLLELGKLAQLGRDQQATGRVHFLFAGVTDQQALDRRRLRIEDSKPPAPCRESAPTPARDRAGGSDADVRSAPVGHRRQMRAPPGGAPEWRNLPLASRLNAAAP
jgi:hypothetical protein